MMVTLSTSTLLAEKIHVEGYYKNSSFEIGDSWLDSGKRQHFESAKSLGEISLYSEFFSFKGTTESDLYLSFFDSNFNGSLDSNDHNVLDGPWYWGAQHGANFDGDEVLVMVDNGPGDLNNDIGVFETDIMADNNPFLQIQGATYFFSVVDTGFTITNSYDVKPIFDSNQRIFGETYLAEDTTVSAPGVMFTLWASSDNGWAEYYGVSNASGSYNIGALFSYTMGL